MANYQYDEGGSMAAYFMLTFLSLVLIPFTFMQFTSSSSRKHEASGCGCSLCLKQQQRIKKRNKRSLLNPKLGAKTLFLLGGWCLFVFLSYKVTTIRSDTKVYDPFEILGINSGLSEKEIRSHYRKLSLKFHPDKVKLEADQTMEMMEAHFIELTKAYKSLTDETIRRNYELYGHPDGRQEVSMGIAIPKWVVEGQHKFLVLIGYCLVLGALLPLIVGRWWFGNKIRTKDGVHVKSAEIFFKNIKEDTNIKELLDCLGRAYEIEFPKVNAALGDLEEKVRSRLDEKYKGSSAQTLLYAYLLRIPIDDPSLLKAQDEVIFRSPALLSSLLNIAMAHNWLTPTLNAMRLHAHLVQAVSPTLPSSEATIFSQLPNVSENDVKSVLEEIGKPDVKTFIEHLQKISDERAKEAAKAAESWGKLELVEATFKVIGERIVTPMSIVQLLIKVRVSPSTGVKHEQNDEKDVDSIKRSIKSNEEKDQSFLVSKRDTEELTNGLEVLKSSHTPYWPMTRKPSWWVLVTDAKLNRTVMPPMRISDVPISDPSKDRNFRSYKLQFQAPQQVGLFTWKLQIVSDTFLGDEIMQDMILKIDDISLLSAEEQGRDDDISDPEEDSLAGQMALMKGGNVKRSPVHDESDDESETDEGESVSDSSSSSSSDSD